MVYRCVSFIVGDRLPVSAGFQVIYLVSHSIFDEKSGKFKKQLNISLHKWQHYLKNDEGTTMGRHMSLNDNMVVSVRIEKDMHQILHEIASLESLQTGRVVSVNELIRNAIEYVYTDNERLRECFRRSRSHITSRLK